VQTQQPTARQPGWQRRFGELVVRHLSKPFEWGRHDCCTWAADAVMALRGHDTLAPTRVPRLNARQGLRAMKAAGGPEAITRCGLQPIAPAQASRGDLVLLQQGRRQLLAVCNGADALAPGARGLESLPMRCALRAWSV
jgi:hypothetical protein